MSLQFLPVIDKIKETRNRQDLPFGNDMREITDHAQLFQE